MHEERGERRGIEDEKGGLEEVVRERGLCKCSPHFLLSDFSSGWKRSAVCLTAPEVDSIF